MEFLRWLLMEDVQRIRATFSAGGPYGAPALLGALIFAGAYYVGRRRARSRSMSLRAFTRTIFAKRIILHPSSLDDQRDRAGCGVRLAGGGQPRLPRPRGR